MDEQIHVSLKPELINIFGFQINNSLFTMIIVMVILVILMLSALARPKLVPGRWQALWEYICESMLSLVENNMGRTKLARRMFPLIATLFIFILFANWFSLLPGVGSVGYQQVEVVPAKSTNEEKGFTAGDYSLITQENKVYSDPGRATAAGKVFGPESAVRILQVQGNSVQVQAVPLKVYESDASTFDKGTSTIKPLTGEQAITGWVPAAALEHAKLGKLLTPIIRPPNADLNMTLAMALIAVVTANVLAIISHGFVGWLKEFFPKPYAMDILLTPIEIIGQFARIASLTFRLFGNIFAGEVLLAVILNIGAPALIIFLALELFFGFIQALVFASLTLVYITLAVVGLDDESHGDHGEAHDHEAGDKLEQYPHELAPKEREAVGSL